MNKKFLLLLAASLLMITGTPDPVTGKGGQFLVTGDDVNLRDAPSRSSRVLGRLSAGEKVAVLGRSASPERIGGFTAHWFRVRTGKGAVGWVYGAYLVEDSAAGAGGPPHELKEGSAGTLERERDYRNNMVTALPSGLLLWATAVKFRSREELLAVPAPKRYRCVEYLFSADETAFFQRYGFFTRRLDPRDLGSIEIDDMVDLYSRFTGVYPTDEVRQMTDFDEAPSYVQAPVFITADYLLHVYHLLFMHMTEEMEQKRFYPALRELTSSLLKESLDLYRSTEGKGRDGIKKAAAFFAVPAMLMGIDFDNEEIRKIASEDAGAISERKGMIKSAVTGEEEDFSQYLPRGHYTKTEELKIYFKAMMWYGRMYFPLKDPYPGMVITRLLSSPKNLGLWESIYLPTSYLAGKSDDLDYYAYHGAMKSVFGERGAPGAYPSDGEMKRFTGILESRKPRIISSRSGGAGPEEDLKAMQGFRFMGQRFVPDSYAFSELTSPRVGTDLAPRNMPEGSDIMALLGSRDAEEMMIAEYGSVPGYRKALDRLKGEFTSMFTDSEMQTIYRDWLYSIGGLFTEPVAGLPKFVYTPQWRYRVLMAGHGSWAELRHDTILYAKQSYSEKGSGGEPETVYYAGLPEVPKGYVEPNPRFMERLSAMVRNTGDLLRKGGVLTDAYRQKLDDFTSVVGRLGRIVEGEVAGSPLSDDDALFISNLTGTMKKVAVTGDPHTFAADPNMKKMAVIADVHTDTLAQKVLEVGVGIPRQIFIHVNDASGSRVCTGYIYSYYEFGHPMSDRLTDEAWRKGVYDPDAQKDLRKREPRWTRRVPTVQ